jgi:hypothetical protein
VSPARLDQLLASRLHLASAFGDVQVWRTGYLRGADVLRGPQGSRHVYKALTYTFAGKPVPGPPDGGVAWDVLAAQGLPLSSCALWADEDLE